MSGFAAVTGEPDGPPTLPPFGLADGVAALTTAFGIMTALRAREATGRGQVLDMAIIEPMLTILGPQLTAYDQLGTLQPRSGNRSSNNAPRNTYRCADGSWVAVSTSAQSIAERVVRLVGRPDFAEQPWFATGTERARHAEELDAAVGGWIAERKRDEVIAAFERAQAAVAPVYTAADVLADPQFAALGSVVRLDDDELVRCACRTCRSGSARRPARYAPRDRGSGSTPPRCWPPTASTGNGSPRCARRASWRDRPRPRRRHRRAPAARHRRRTPRGHRSRNRRKDVAMTDPTTGALLAAAAGAHLVELGQPLFTGMPCSPTIRGSVWRSSGATAT